jgi:hypothetical protein
VSGFTDCEDCQETLSESTSSDSSSSTAIFSSSSEDDGNVANLNGTNHFFSRASNSELQLPLNMKWTFTGWFIADTIIGTQHLVSKFDDNNKEYNISIDLNGRIRVSVVDSSDNYIVDIMTNTIIEVGIQYNFSVSSNGQVIILYLNGQEESKVAINGTPRQSTSTFQLGAKVGTDLHFDGALFCINYWHRALTYEEVNIIYNEGQPYACACIDQIFTEISSMSSGFMSSSSSTSSLSSFISSSSSTDPASSNSSSESSSSTEATLITDLISCWDLGGDSLDKFGSNDLTNNNSVPFDRFVNKIKCDNSSSSSSDSSDSSDSSHGQQM